MPQKNPNEARVVRLTNIFDFDYTHAYGGVPYQLRAGVTQLFPWAIGDHLATHLARQALIRKAPIRDENSTDGRGGESTRSDRPLWDEAAINDLKNRIIKDAYTEERAAPMTEAEMYRRKVEELNKEFPDQVAKALSGVQPTPVAPTSSEGSPPPTNDNVAVGSAKFADNGTTTTELKTYQDKAEIIEALKAKGVVFDARLSKANLEKLLK